MFGKKHKDHEINKLDQIYSNHVDIIKNESKEITKKFDQLNIYLKSINDKIISVGSYKLDKSNELEELFDSLKSKLENRVHVKLTKLMQCKNDISDKLKFLENIKYNIEKELSDAPKSILIAKSDELVKNLKNLNFDSESLEAKFSENVNLNISAEIPSEVSPQYESAVFEILDYKTLISHHQLYQQGISYPVNSNNLENNSSSNNSGSNKGQMKFPKEKEFIYSPELFTNGLVWRLKVYPYGNGAAKGEYISIFLELIEGLSESSKYYYKIELCNLLFLQGDKRHANHSREFSSDFTNGECWGYNRFYKIENLEREGFIDQIGKLMIKFYVRPQTYSQLCRDQKNYITTLEKRLKYYTSKEKNNLGQEVINKENNAEVVDLAEVTPQLKEEPIPNSNVNNNCNTDLNTHVSNEGERNIRTSEEIAMNNFNMINKINNHCSNDENPKEEEETVANRENEEIKENTENKNMINDHKEENNNIEQNIQTEQNNTLPEKNNKHEIKIEENINTNTNPNTDTNIANNPQSTTINNNPSENPKNEANENENEIVITEIKLTNNNPHNATFNKNIYDSNTGNKFKEEKKSLEFTKNNNVDEFFPNNKEVSEINFNYDFQGLKNKHPTHRVNNNFDIYEEDLSFNSNSKENLSHLNFANFIPENNFVISHKKNNSVSEDGN